MSLILFSHSNDTTCKGRRNSGICSSFGSFGCSFVLFYPCFYISLFLGQFDSIFIQMPINDRSHQMTNTLLQNMTMCVHTVQCIVFFFYFITSIFAVIYYSIYTARFFCTFVSFFSPSTNLPIIYSPTYSSGKLLSLHMNNNDNTAFFNDCCLHLMSIKKKTKYYVRISIIFLFFFIVKVDEIFFNN